MMSRRRFCIIRYSQFFFLYLFFKKEVKYDKMLMSISKQLEIRSSRTASGIRRPVSQFVIVVRSTNSISASCCWDSFF